MVSTWIIRVLAMSYAELFCRSNFSFLTGASHPEELIEQAMALNYQALALTDECSLAGVVRAYAVARKTGFHFIVGSYFRSEQGLSLVILATDRDSYAQLSALITKARRRTDKGQYQLHDDDLRHAVDGCLAIWLPLQQPEDLSAQSWVQFELLKAGFPKGFWLGVSLLADGKDAIRIALAQDFQQQTGTPIVAVGDVLMHQRERLPLQQVLTAIRLGTTVEALGNRRQQNAERYLRALPELACWYPQEWLQQTLVIADQCRFSLGELKYEYPKEVVPEGKTPSEHLRELVEQGARKRWPGGIKPAVRETIEKELALVAELKYESYFLTVHDIVKFAKKKNILCQGRGSAANSVICFCLEVTEVDPARIDVLFERFLSKERDEPPDIDIDFEHERREEVIQYIFDKYSRKRTALTATVISYQLRSAVRDVGKALGIELSLLEKLSNDTAWWERADGFHETLRRAGIDPRSAIVRQFLKLLAEIQGFPRHLSQHVGGFVISNRLLSELVPVENAAMKDRTVIQWNKDDIETLGLLKVDVLGLGILTAIRRTLAFMNQYSDRQWHMQDLMEEDPRVYQMLQKADTVGVFQIESRAQMSMLPRLKPKRFYDLVIEVAIVRPGPIQGGMVHPYLKRRDDPSLITGMRPELEPVLGRTLGVPIFQEQVLKLAMVAAGFSGGEADELRRAMGAWKKRGELERYQAKLVTGMRQRDYDEQFIEQLCAQIAGFGEYGFPESHAASFALLAYATSWLKCHHPAAYCAALINSQPMGFYSPSQLVQDVRRHGVTVLPVDVLHSDWDCTLERMTNGELAIRLGLRLVKSLSQETAKRIEQIERRSIKDLQQLTLRADLNRAELLLLSRAGALRSISGNRHQAHWQTLAVEENSLASEALRDEPVELPAPTEGQNLIADYAYVGLTLDNHPMQLLRERREFTGCRRAGELPALGNRAHISVAGVVTNRQRPGTASGVLFMTLEDETGNHNLVIWPDTLKRFRQACLHGYLLRVDGRLEQKDGVIHVIAGHIRMHNELLGELELSSRDFH